LHLLASEGDTEAVTFLLDNGADVDARDAEGCTALHWAADRGCSEVSLCMSPLQTLKAANLDN
jgi:ankyrin repeat protein